MYFADIDGTVLLTCGEYDRGFTRNQVEFLGFESGLELLVEHVWWRRRDYILVRGDSALAMRLMTGEWRASAPHRVKVYECVGAHVLYVCAA